MLRNAATALVATVAVFTGLILWVPAGVGSTVGKAPGPVSLDSMRSDIGSTAARQKALRKCRKIDGAKRRAACMRRVEKRYGKTDPKPVTPAGPIEDVDVRDKYFSPTLVEIPRGGSVRWIWGDENADPHNVTLLGGPRGVSPYDFETPLSPSVNYTFKRRFTVAGTYRFACSLHHLMEMNVEVGG